MPIDLDTIPKGAWVRREGDTIVIGTVLRDKIISNIILGLVVTGMAPIFLYIALYFTDLPIIIRLFTSFIAIIIFIFLGHRTIMTLFGHIEIKLSNTEGVVFSGIGKIGRTKKFIFKNTHSIEEYVAVYTNKVPTQFGIEIETDKKIFFGGYMKNEKVKFFIKMLRLFLIDGDKVRDLLPVDLMEHLIE